LAKVTGRTSVWPGHALFKRSLHPRRGNKHVRVDRSSGLPFTRDEIYRALASVSEYASRATMIADHLNEIGPTVIALREKARTHLREGGIPNADMLVQNPWVYSPELLPALAALSPEVAARVEQLNQQTARGASGAGLVRRQRARHLPCGNMPNGRLLACPMGQRWPAQRFGPCQEKNATIPAIPFCSPWATIAGRRLLRQ
jgi:hypothetical protein